jgi:hypothetical protein
MTKIHKEIILAIFIVLFGTVSWFLLHRFFYFDDGITLLILTVLGFLLWGISLGLGSLLINKKIISYSTFALSLLSFFIFFHQQVEALYYFIVLILIFVSLLIYQRRVKHEEKARIKLHFWRIFRKGLPLVFTFICILVSLAYYFSPDIMQDKTTKIKIPNDIFNIAIKPLEGLIGERLPQGVDLDSDINKFLPLDQIKELERQFGIDINKGDTGRDVLYKLVDYQLNHITGPYKKFIPLGLAIGLFFVLRVVAIVLIPFIVSFSYLIVKILISAGFAKIVTTSVEMEDIEI